MKNEDSKRNEEGSASTKASGNILFDTFVAAVGGILKQAGKIIFNSIIEIGGTWIDLYEGKRKLSEKDFLCFYYCAPLIKGSELEGVDIDQEIRKFVVSDEFEKNLFEMMLENKFLKNKVEAMRECLLVLRGKNYLSSVLIAASQVEGVITDMLLAKGLCVQRDRSYFQVNENGKKIRLPGLTAKAELLKNSFRWSLNHQALESLLADVFNEDSKINHFRNDLMHGTVSKYPTEKDAVKLICWFYALIIIFHTMRTSESIQDEVG